MTHPDTPSVLIIDDSESFRNGLAKKLAREGYNVSTCAGVDETLEWLQGNAAPTFTLVDRQFGGQPVEEFELERLTGALGHAQIVVYTSQENLTPDEMCAIQRKGAVRVLDKDDVERLVDNIAFLTEMLDVLLELERQLDEVTQERAKFTAALVGTDVGLTVIDRHFRCWFTNRDQERIVGGPCSDGQCWCLFHGHDPAAGHCWGCTVDEVLRTGSQVHRLFLSRFRSGDVKWVEVLSTPIRRPGCGPPEDGAEPQRGKRGYLKDVLAVREGVSEVGRTRIDALPLEVRLQHVATGLIHAGFGRARIYRTRRIGGEEEAGIVAAASRSDLPHSRGYVTELKNVVLPIERCPYTRGPVEAKADGRLVEDWSEHGESPWKDTLGLVPPYFTIPVWNDDGRETTCGFMGVDFETLPDPLREISIKRFANQETLEWIQRQYASEVRSALLIQAAAPEAPRWEVVERTRLRVGSAGTVATVLEALSDALSELLPDCRVSTRRKTDEGLALYGPLSPHRGERVPPTILWGDRTSLAMHCVYTQRPIFIPDHPRHRETAAEHGLPPGYSRSDALSTAHIPVRLENTMLGALSIDAKEQIDWEAEGYLRPLLSLADLLALTLHDVALQDELERGRAQTAAMTAFYAGIASHAIWHHWALGRLAEASAHIEVARSLAGTPPPTALDERLTDVQDILSEAGAGRMPEAATPRCYLPDAVSVLRQRYLDRGIDVEFAVADGLPPVAMPPYHVHRLIEIFVDNAIEAISESDTGSMVRVSAGAHDDVVVVTVRDDGPGVPKWVHPLISRESVPPELGSRLGLLIALGTTLEYGGDVELAAGDGGACFDISLPVAGK